MIRIADYQGAAQTFHAGLDARSARMRLSLEPGEPTRLLSSGGSKAHPSWTKGKVLAGLKRRCKIESEEKTSAGDWMIAATDRETGLRLVAFLERDPEGGRERLRDILFGAAFEGRTGWKVEEWQADEVEGAFKEDPILVNLNDGVLYIFASPKLEAEFDRDLFDGQLAYFLLAMKIVANILYG